MSNSAFLRHLPDRLITVALSGGLLAACSGSPSDDAPAASAAAVERSAKSPPALLSIEGCVVDKYSIPRTGTSVRVLTDDGRLLGHATSGRYGEFVMHVVAHDALSVAVDRDGGEAFAVRTGGRDLRLTGCLQDADG
ncbi:MAG TPA: hypothetical protein PKA20_12465 [Burkholderiaceae bacterium]|nr:hypothetical protein [Burkholderiaceae bacterium]